MSHQPSDANIKEIVDRCRSGDQEAAAILFYRYVDRLIALVRGRLSQKFNSRIDPDDVLQSAYRSFFGGLCNDKFTVEGADELWGLLAAITLRKLYRQVGYHMAKKRSVHREQPAAGEDNPLQIYPELVAELPTPAEAAGVVEELELVMSRYNSLERQMAEMRLAGYSVEEIAAETKRSARTVRRLMEKMKAEFQRRLMATCS